MEKKKVREVMRNTLGIGDSWMWLRIKVTRMGLENIRKHILLDLRGLYYFFFLRWMVEKYAMGCR